VTDPVVLAILSLLWIACSTVGGLLLAHLARRLHPDLSLRRLWVFYTALLGTTVALVLAIAWW
jgi:hypothetical protein